MKKTPPVITAVNQRENDLVRQARGGDAKSFCVLVELYQERAIHIANSFVGNFEDARDIAQEAFVKAYQNLPGFKEESRFYTWFYRIIVNTCKDFLRKRKVRGFVSLWAGKTDERGENDPVLQLADPSKNASEQVINRETGVRIYKAIDRLPFQQKSAFNLRYLEGLSIEEISETLGITPGAVKATLWQAAQKMRLFLGGTLDGS